MALPERVKYLIHNVVPDSSRGWHAIVLIADAESVRWNDVPLAWIRAVLLEESVDKPLNELTKEDIDYSKVVLNADTMEYFDRKRNFETPSMKQAPTQNQLETWIMARVSDYVESINSPPAKPRNEHILWLEAIGITHVRTSAGQTITVATLEANI